MTELSDYQRVLVLAPHTDDGEFGCGGTIAKFIDQGKDVFYAAFSACQQSVLKEFPPDILITEVKAATQVLGIRPENLILYDYEVRTFTYHRQAILDHLIELRQAIRPDLILMPSISDIHQDHHTVAVEGLRAFKFKSILCYEVPWNNLSFNTSAFVHLSEAALERKIAALREYKSQQHRPYASPDFLRSWASMRGVQIGTKYAETFDITRWIID
jgi:LmbE family N-acetylglucosaminyl deacetylase